MKEEKKNFVPDVFTGNLDIKKKWFVFYYEPLVNGHFPKRIKVYEGINRIKTIEGRLKKAEEIFCRSRKDKPVVYGFKKPAKNRVDSVLLDALEAMKNYSDLKTIATYEGMVKKFHVFISTIFKYNRSKNIAK